MTVKSTNVYRIKSIRDEVTKIQHRRDEKTIVSISVSSIVNRSYQGTKACAVLVGENSDTKPLSSDGNKTSTSATASSSQSGGRTRQQASSGGSISPSTSMSQHAYTRKRRDTYYNQHAWLLHQTVSSLERDQRPSSPDATSVDPPLGGVVTVHETKHANDENESPSSPLSLSTTTALFTSGSLPRANVTHPLESSTVANNRTTVAASASVQPVDTFVSLEDRATASETTDFDDVESFTRGSIDESGEFGDARVGTFVPGEASSLETSSASVESITNAMRRDPAARGASNDSETTLPANFERAESGFDGGESYTYADRANFQRDESDVELESPEDLKHDGSRVNLALENEKNSPTLPANFDPTDVERSTSSISSATTESAAILRETKSVESNGESTNVSTATLASVAPAQVVEHVDVASLISPKTDSPSRPEMEDGKNREAKIALNEPTDRKYAGFSNFSDVVKEMEELSREDASAESEGPHPNYTNSSEKSEELQRDYPVYNYGQDEVEIVRLSQEAARNKEERDLPLENELRTNNVPRKSSLARQSGDLKVITREESDEEFLRKFGDMFNHERSSEDSKPKLAESSAPPLTQQVKIIEVPVDRSRQSSSSSSSSQNHRLLVNITIASGDSKPLYVLSVSVPTGGEDTVDDKRASNVNVDEVKMHDDDRPAVDDVSSMAKNSATAEDNRLPPPPQPPSSPPPPIWAGGECECSCPCMDSSSDEWDTFSAMDESSLLGFEDLASHDTNLSMNEHRETTVSDTAAPASSKDEAESRASSTKEETTSTVGYENTTTEENTVATVEHWTNSSSEDQTSGVGLSCSGTTPLPPEPTILILEGEAPFYRYSLSNVCSVFTLLDSSRFLTGCGFSFSFSFFFFF